VVEALALMLVTSTDRHPIHAATVVKDGAALLLAGPSGVGKSTLAYAASRAGLEVRGDESAYVQRQLGLRLWGTPDRLQLSAAGATHFPELREVPRVQSINGKSKVIVRREVHEHEWQPVDRMAVCLLSGGDGSVEVERLAAAEILHALTSDVEPGFDLRPEEGCRVAEALARPGGWRVTLSQDPAEAIGVFEEMLREI
jgi:energy-coupling factor transporter ATP-binding protein EcfA2